MKFSYRKRRYLLAAPLFVSSLRGEFICSGVFVLFYNLTFPLLDAMLGIVEAHSNGYNLFAFVTERFGISLFFYLSKRFLRRSLAPELELKKINGIGGVHHAVGAPCCTMRLSLHEEAHNLKDEIYRRLIVLFPPFNALWRRAIIGNSCNECLQASHKILCIPLP